MADEKDEIIDIDTMSDEEFMKLDPSQMQEVPAEEEEEKEPDNDSNPDSNVEEENSEDTDPIVESVVEEGTADSKPDPDAESGEDKGELEEGAPTIDPNTEASDPETEDPVKTEETQKGEDPKPAKPDASKELDADGKKKEPVVAVDTAAAVDFFTKVSAPFKADGRDMQVRSPEDAIRLMQMGVNYSRRMEEMKPLRAQDQMLKTNGLDDPEKLNFLIDLSKGNPDAIKKLLSDHKIDPIDIDTSNDAPYQPKNFQGDPKDLAFKDAISNTVSAEGGRDLIREINSDWDDNSKEALRDQPAILQNVLAQKQSGVYLKIKTELDYQRTMGFLTDVPFLQAYHQVGEAMQKAGVFGTEEAQPAEVTKAKVAPLGTGPRKAAQQPKTVQPTPNVSSATPPRSVASNDAGQNEPDYSTLSDEDFMKLAPPG